jgi:hypothetical protein
MKIYAIETNDGVYVSDNPNSSYNTQTQKYLFDGEKPSVTFSTIWFKINRVPKRISHIENRDNINYRFILIDKSLASEKIPLEIPKEEVGEFIDYTFYWKEQYRMYQSLYEEVYDKQEPIEVEDEFEYIVLAVVDDIKEPQKICYPFEETRLYGRKGEITNLDISHSILDEIVYPKLTIHERPCKLTSKQTYNIIREHVKRNINPKVATITSDYDFCFTVKKIIPLATPYSYEHDINNSLFDNRKRKPKYITKWIDKKEIVCFEMTNKEDNHKGYSPVDAFEGENEDKLKENIDNYLKELMDYINEPLKECPYCYGKGVELNGEAPCIKSGNGDKNE